MQVLTQRNVYILPTGTGLAFGGLLVALLLASINYQLSLGYLLTFALAASAAASMHLTHGTLRGLKLHLQPASAVRVGEAVSWTVIIDNPGRARWGIGLAWATRRSGDSAGLSAPGGSPIWVDVGTAGQVRATLAAQALQRGHWRTPPITLETRFPLGLFRAWTWWRPAASVTVWPRPEQPCPPLPGVGHRGTPAEDAEPQPPAPTTPLGSTSLPSGSGDADIIGLRSYRPGDRLNQIAWRRVPADGGWLSLETQELPPTDQRSPVWLNWADTAGLADEEARWSRLAAWVDRAHQQGRAFGLRLPSQVLEWDEGPEHHRRAMDALAGPPLDDQERPSGLAPAAWDPPYRGTKT